ncbi:FHA domain-containing protein [Cohnella fermenti]|uniref:FHA domain-containing protein n=1 Tax=Cohnella fermenti TaxID=2565925 RepID=A0A4S4BF31_9BACL|nr:FHA domain-containing protein [Cohnella fermenti]THF72736.1 FHA domain-containing protein [Cohnella fermenti]
MKLFGLEQAILYVQREKNDFEFATTKETIRAHVTNVVILMENIVKESLRIYGFLLFDKAYVQKLKSTLDVNLDKKLMFGEALRGLRLLYRVKHDSHAWNTFQTLFERSNIYFDKNDSLEKQLAEVSSLRGSILHDEQEGIVNLDDYKNKGRKCINLSEEILIHLKSRRLFPTIVRFQALTESNGKREINFEDEIGGRFPVEITSALDIKELQARKWYVFKNAKVQKFIPVFSELITLVGSDESKVSIQNKLTEAPTMLALGLLEVNENQVIRWHNIYGTKTTIGRSEENDLIVGFPSISRRHSELLIDHDQVFIIDTSTHGTYLNGEKLNQNQRYRIKNGDIITLGIGAEKVNITFHKNNVSC